MSVTITCDEEITWFERRALMWPNVEKRERERERWAMPSPDHEAMLILRAGVLYSSPSRFPEPFLGMSQQRPM